MAWCEGNGVDFLFGLARNERLVAEIVTELDLVAAKSRRSGRGERRFKSFMWTTRRTWSRRRRVVAPSGRRGKPIRASWSPRCGATSARPSIFTRRSTAPAARWRTGSRSASSTSMRIAPRPPRCGPTSCACGSTQWLSAALRPAPHRAARYRLRQRHLRHHPSQAAQDRSTRARQRPPHQDRHGIGLPGRARLGTRRNPARNRCHRPRLPGVTRAAPARSLRAQLTDPRRSRKLPTYSAFGATNTRGAGPASDKIGLPGAQSSVV